MLAARFATARWIIVASCAQGIFSQIFKFENGPELNYLTLAGDNPIPPPSGSFTLCASMFLFKFQGNDGAVHIRLDSGRPWISFYVYKFGSDPDITLWFFVRGVWHNLGSADSYRQNNSSQ
ncbi:uncharacterized protein LOC111710815 [Eurytemora carolleeae]|uniref:uncharacterized protein LOC111710815 n=1 Tax=Eurytemora carolleeae TaxID=1294199 RepID=UPI000C79544F|nr:uncharacterized protein LOC111710815 [Eurytemora carolleeae]|eukprot:XP_023340728.1 uncharacterized protein LOC111710815 [Eurytemora affinis]